MDSILINKNAKNIDDVVNIDWKLVKINKNIFSIENTNWVIKIYKDVKHAKSETKNLNLLEGIKGIPSLLASSFLSEVPFIILSKLEGVDIYEYMKINGTFSEKKCKAITIQILKILKKVHKKGIIHKDIKPENILITQDYKISIIDFEGRCTLNFLSPEQVNCNKLTTKTDMWSLGISIFKMLTNSKLFKNKKEILSKEFDFPRDWSVELKDFLFCLLDRNVLTRYSVEDALNHAWLHL